MSIFKSAVIAALSIVAILASTADAQCPGTPLQRCDFYFSGYKNSIPSFKLRLGGDQLVSPARLRTKMNDVLVYVAVTDGFSYPPRDIRDQFYLYGYPGSQLRTKTFKRPISFFTNLCIVLKIKIALIKVDPGKPAISLTSGDGNKMFPEKRRCVVFKTRY